MLSSQVLCVSVSNLCYVAAQASGEVRLWSSEGALLHILNPFAHASKVLAQRSVPISAVALSPEAPVLAVVSQFAATCMVVTHVAGNAVASTRAAAPLHPTPDVEERDLLDAADAKEDWEEWC